MKNILAIATLALAATLSGCGGGGGGDQPLVVPRDSTLAANAAVTAAVAQTPFTFPNGVPGLGTTAATTVTFTSATANPAFSISSGGNTATGTTAFGSCIFKVAQSNFPAGDLLATGNTVTVHPCSLFVDTSGTPANGQSQTVAIELVLGTATSTSTTATITVTPAGELTVNGVVAGSVGVAVLTGS